jgi:hypothetical protein
MDDRAMRRSSALKIAKPLRNLRFLEMEVELDNDDHGTVDREQEMEAEK